MKKLKFLGFLLMLQGILFISCETESDLENVNPSTDEIVAAELVADLSRSSSIPTISVTEIEDAFGNFRIRQRLSFDGLEDIDRYDPDELLIPVAGTEQNNFLNARRVSIDSNGLEFLAGNGTSRGTVALDQLNRIIFNASVNGATPARLVFRLSTDGNALDIFNITERFAFRFERI